MKLEKRAIQKRRVLVTTLTKKIAEELTEYYIELGVKKVKYIRFLILILWKELK